MNPHLPLRQLVSRLGALHVEGALDAEVAALAYDPRRVVPGALFFAVSRGGEDDGLAIPRAIERGAAAIVCEQFGFVPYRATRIRVANCRRAMAAAAAAFHGHPSRDLRIVAVTGGPDRLRVAYVLYALCQAAGLSAGLIGGLGCRVADRVLPPLGSDPEALDVQELLSGMRRSGCQTCVVELPTAAIQQGCLDSTDLFALVSVDWSPRDGQKATTRDGPNDSSSRCTGAPSSHGWDPVESGGSRPWRIARCASEAGEEAEEINLYFQGAFRSALASGLLRGAFQRLGPGSSRVEVRTPAGPLSLRIPFPGRANARAVMAAAAVALALRLPGRDIEHAVARLEPIPGHLEPVITRRPFRVLVDGCRSVAEFEQTLRAVREFTPARVLLLFGCGAGHDRSARARIGELAARGADLAVLTSDNPGWEAPEVIAAQVASGYIRIRGLAPRFIPDRGEAIRRLLGEASAGDCVLLAGKGHRPLEQVAGCVLPFDDRAHARAALHAVDSFRGGAEVSA